MVSYAVKVGGFSGMGCNQTFMVRRASPSEHQNKEHTFVRSIEGNSGFSMEILVVSKECLAETLAVAFYIACAVALVIFTLRPAKADEPPSLSETVPYIIRINI